MSFPLVGCWDKIELEDLGYVAVIGIDKREDNLLDITFQITNVQVGTSNQTEVDEPAFSTITFAATDIMAARELADAAVSRRLTFTHTVAIIFSEKIARDDNFFQILHPLTRNIELRSHVNVIISKEKTSEFIRRNNPVLETRPGKFYNFMAQRWKESGIVPQSTLRELIQSTQDDISACLCSYATTKHFSSGSASKTDFDYKAGEIPKEAENTTEIIGSAVFKEGRMIGVISGEETRLALLLRPKKKLQRIITTFPDPLDNRYKITAIISLKRASAVRIDTSNKNPKVYVRVPLGLEILAIPSFIDYVTDLKAQNILEVSLEEYLQEKAMNLVNKTQTEFRIEPFLWGYNCQKNFSTIKELETYDWINSYPNAEVYINFDVSITNFGRHLAPPSLQELHD